MLINIIFIQRNMNVVLWEFGQFDIISYIMMTLDVYIATINSSLCKPSRSTRHFM